MDWRKKFTGLCYNPDFVSDYICLAIFTMSFILLLWFLSQMNLSWNATVQSSLEVPAVGENLRLVVMKATCYSQ